MAATVAAWEDVRRMPPPNTEAELREVLHRSTLPLATVSMVDLTVRDANHAALCALGYDDEFTAMSLADVLQPADAKVARTEMALLADGAILAYEAHRKLQHADGHTIEAHVWVRSLHHVVEDTALVVFMEEGSAQGSDELIDDFPATRLRLSGPVVVGTIDLDMRIVRLSAEIEELVGEEPAALIGQPIVERIHRDDVAAFLLGLGRAIADGVASAMQVRFRHADGSYVPLRVVVTPTRGGQGPRLGIVLTEESVDAGSDTRVADLERHLWRIALEVQSAGVVDGLQRLPDPSEIPGLEDLSTRQWEIVTRLLRGERVPDIATATFVSQSTVRNQLATIYRKLGVHSQTELLALLRSTGQTV
jgi:PAS domain S-box-containing protein